MHWKAINWTKSFLVKNYGDKRVTMKATEVCVYIIRSNCVRGTRKQPLICVGCSVHYWVSCAINKVGFFKIAFIVVVVDTHLPCFEVLAYVLPHFDT